MIYLDNAATTRLDPYVAEEIRQSLHLFGNPSSLYDLGKESKHLIHTCRTNIEKRLFLPPNTFVFTSGGSESDNFAIKAGYLHGLTRGRRKIVTSVIEHHAILNACKVIEKLGAIVEYVKVRTDGSLDLDDLRSKVDQNTAIVSIMMTNNEIGTNLDIRSAAEIAHVNGALFHTDAVQGIPHNPLLVSDIDHIDMLSVSGHKFGAPKGIGGIYVRSDLIKELQGCELISGGKQEFGLRAGTENIPYILGFSKAVERMVDGREVKNERIQMLFSYTYNTITKEFPCATINGPSDLNGRNPAILNVSLHKADGASIVEWMNLRGICISSGSACNTGSAEPSHVLKAIGLSDQDAFSSIRISFSDQNTIDEIDEFIDVLHGFERRYMT